jgi:hypothetical protein
MKGIIVLKAQSSLRETIRGAQQQSNIDKMVVATVGIFGDRVRKRPRRRLVVTE